MSFWVFATRRKVNWPMGFQRIGRPCLTGKGDSISSLSPDFYQVTSTVHKPRMTHQ